MKNNETLQCSNSNRLRNGQRKQWVSSLTLVAVMVMAALHSSQAELREFTSADGRKIKAEILHGTTELVTIQLENGSQVSSKISVFSEDDQKFIKTWIETQPPKINFNFDIKYKKLKDSEKQSSTKSHKITVEKWYYELGFSSRNRIELDDLELRYRMFVQSEHEKGRSEKAIYIADGLLKVASMAPNAKANLNTTTVPLTTSKLKPEYEYKNGERDRLSDDLAGLWVKVFHDGKCVWEFKSPHKAVNDGTFTDSAALKIGEPKSKK
jgi:hypothetical protein